MKSPTDRAMWEALWRGRPTAFLALWRQAGAPERPTSDKGARWATSWLEIAIHQGCVGAVKGLIQAGVSLTMPEKGGSPLWAVLYAMGPHTSARYAPPDKKAARLASIALLLIQAGLDPNANALPETRFVNGAGFLTFCLDDQYVALVDALVARKGLPFFRRDGFGQAINEAVYHRSPLILDRALTWLAADAPGELPETLTRVAKKLASVWHHPGCMRVLARHGHDWSRACAPDFLFQLAQSAHAHSKHYQPLRQPIGEETLSLQAQYLPSIQALLDLGAGQGSRLQKTALLVQVLRWTPAELAPLRDALIEELIQRGWRLAEADGTIPAAELAELGSAFGARPLLALHAIPRFGLSWGMATSTAGTLGGLMWETLAHQYPNPQADLLASLARGGFEPTAHRLTTGAPLLHATVSPAWIQWLQAKGADLEELGPSANGGLTPLLFAARIGEADHMGALAEAGANPRAEAAGKGLAQWAMGSGNKQAIVRALTLCPPQPGQPLWHTYMTMTRLDRRQQDYYVDALEEAHADWLALDDQDRRPLDLWLEECFAGRAVALPHASPGMAQALLVENAGGDWPAESAFRHLLQMLDRQQVARGSFHLHTLLAHGARVRRTRFPDTPFYETLPRMVEAALIHSSVAQLFHQAAIAQDLDTALRVPTPTPRRRL